MFPHVHKLYTERNMSGNALSRCKVGASAGGEGVYGRRGGRGLCYCVGNNSMVASLFLGTGRER